MKLYEITSQYQAIFDEVTEDGEITETDFEKLDGLKEDFVAKAINVAGYIKNLEAESDAIARAIQDMKVRQNSLENKAQSLRDYLQFNLQELNINEIEIPPEYFKEKVTLSLDKSKVKEDITAGIEIPGVTMHRNIKLEIK